MATLLDAALLTDTLKALPGWQGDSQGIYRDVALPADQAAELCRVVAVDAGAMGHPPIVEQREGATRFVLRTEPDGGVTELDIAFASHISDLITRIPTAGTETA